MVVEGITETQLPVRKRERLMEWRIRDFGLRWREKWKSQISTVVYPRYPPATLCRWTYKSGRRLQAFGVSWLLHRKSDYTSKPSPCHYIRYGVCQIANHWHRGC
jgi:hypothetical protein